MTIYLEDFESKVRVLKKLSLLFSISLHMYLIVSSCLHVADLWISLNFQGLQLDIVSGLKYVRLFNGYVFKVIKLRSLPVSSWSASLIFLECRRTIRCLILIPIGISSNHSYRFYLPSLLNVYMTKSTPIHRTTCLVKSPY